MGLIHERFDATIVGFRPWKLHIGAASVKFFQPVSKVNFPKIARFF
jgi:hypothetical protein